MSIKKILLNEINFLTKIRKEHLNEPSDFPENIEDDLIDLGVFDNTEVEKQNNRGIDFSKHFTNQIDNQIHLLKSKLKKIE